MDAKNTNQKRRRNRLPVEESAAILRGKDSIIQVNVHHQCAVGYSPHPGTQTMQCIGDKVILRNWSGTITVMPSMIKPPPNRKKVRRSSEPFAEVYSKGGGRFARMAGGD
jgi:hypothetical protein